MTHETRKKVLLVESEDSLARAMDHVVTQAGHACARLSTGDTIVRRVTEERPDLVMLDMSHSNRAAAMDACQTIRRSPDLGGVKILMLQANGNARDRRRGWRLGPMAWSICRFAWMNCAPKCGVCWMTKPRLTPATRPGLSRLHPSCAHAVPDRRGHAVGRKHGGGHFRRAVAAQVCQDPAR